jgi:hypothetical protein
MENIRKNDQRFNKLQASFILSLFNRFDYSYSFIKIMISYRNNHELFLEQTAIIIDSWNRLLFALKLAFLGALGS